ncbi:MAG: amidohydrolase [Bacteroidia bacterium]|nr:amidohydrolase [Bacteroidia bacterium]
MAGSTLRVGWFQLDLAWEAPTLNAVRIERWLSEYGSEAEVWVLPEMWSTGFSMNTQIAEEEPGPSLRLMQAWAATYQALFIGSLMVRVGGSTRNRAYTVFPDGGYKFYDKRHLFRMAEEHHWYTAGKEQLLIEWRGWYIAPLICYDLRFPVWSRRTSKYAYDLLIYVSNWPAVRHAHWESLLRARAIENQAYVLGVNRIGEDATGHSYLGGSALYDFQGRECLNAGTAEGVFFYTLSQTELYAYREKFPAWQDADTFVLLSDLS